MTLEVEPTLELGRLELVALELPDLIEHDGHVRLDEDGRPILDKYGRIIYD